MPPNWLPRIVLFAGSLSIITFTLLLASGNGPSNSLVGNLPNVQNYLNSQLDKSKDDGCKGWDPRGAASQDPPKCLRARQLRQLQAVLVEGEPLFDASAWSMLNHAERCIMGVIKCPERPIIFTDYWYFHTYERSNSGEGIWGDPIIATVRDLNFAPIGVDFHKGREAIWNVTRKLSESIHAYWTDEETIVQCLTDPRCIRPEDYVPAEDPGQRFNLDKIPEEDFGKLEAWRVHPTTFWGARPEAHHGNGGVGSKNFGLTGEPPEPAFSYHPLGNKWHIVPYAYPGHTHIPISVEPSCISAPTTPNDQRDDAVMILAKRSTYFYGRLPIETWDTAVPAMKELGMSFWTVAKEEKESEPVPEGITRYQEMTRAAYGKMVSSAKAMLAIGQPMISPSPYTALCRAVPVLIPYWGEKPTGPDDWQTYGSAYAQHGPALSIGEPYVYGYNISDTDDLIRQLKKAVATPIKSYVPHDMTLSAVRGRVAEVVLFDWEGEYTRIVADNGGRMPSYPKVMIEHINRYRKGDNRAWAIVQ